MEEGKEEAAAMLLFDICVGGYLQGEGKEEAAAMLLFDICVGGYLQGGGEGGGCCHVTI